MTLGNNSVGSENYNDPQVSSDHRCDGDPKTLEKEKDNGCPLITENKPSQCKSAGRCFFVV